jgi:hypothetical protein
MRPTDGCTPFLLLLPTLESGRVSAATRSKDSSSSSGTAPTPP